jgi:DNA-binding YbaB/EbfC family protein
MSGFLGNLGQLASLMKQLPRIKEEMEKVQQRLGQITAEGVSGGGMVKVRVNGRSEVLAVQISEETMKIGDREMLEDLIRSAVNQGLEKARQQAAEEVQKTATGFGLPAGMTLPGT